VTLIAVANRNLATRPSRANTAAWPQMLAPTAARRALNRASRP